MAVSVSLHHRANAHRVAYVFLYFAQILAQNAERYLGPGRTSCRSHFRFCTCGKHNFRDYIGRTVPAGHYQSAGHGSLRPGLASDELARCRHGRNAFKVGTLDHPVGHQGFAHLEAARFASAMQP